MAASLTARERHCRMATGCEPYAGRRSFLEGHVFASQTLELGFQLFVGHGLPSPSCRFSSGSFSSLLVKESTKAPRDAGQRHRLGYLPRPDPLPHGNYGRAASCGSPVHRTVAWVWFPRCVTWWRKSAMNDEADTRHAL